MSAHHPKTDEIKKQFWQYRRVQLGVIIALFAGSYFLPKIPLLRGWPYKFTSTAVEIGKQEVPLAASRIRSAEEAAVLLKTENTNLAGYLKLNGPLPLAAWPCEAVKVNALCVKYLWKDNDSLMVLVTTVSKKYRKKARPFTKGGWSGYFYLSPENDLAFAVTGPFEPKDIKDALPASLFIK